MHWRRIWRHPLFWLGIMVTVFLVISSATSVVAYDNFRSVAATNEGTIAQAVSSATFGHQVPFYESADCVSRDRCSFLIVHTAFILYLAAPFYALAPSTATLLVLQSVVIGLAAIPLYWLTKQATKSSGKALFAAGLYLAWAPLFSTFTLHAESVLPVEILGLAALWQSGRYRWGLLAALVAFLSFEIAPIFVFLVGLFFLLPYGERWVRRQWRKLRNRGPQESENPPRTPGWAGKIRAAWTNREIRYTLLLLLASAVAYAFLVMFKKSWGSIILGIAQPPVTTGVAAFYGGSQIAIAPFATILSSSASAWTADYWLILLGLVAFLPLLAPRSLVVFGPWILFTFLSNSTHYTTIGQPYTIVNTGPIFLGVAYGLARVPWGPPSATTTVEPNSSDTGPTTSSAGFIGPHGRSRAAKAAVAVVFTGVIIANLLLIPINPAMPGLGFKPDEPFASDYFNHSLEITPGMEWADRMVSSIPLQATLAVSSNMYPLVGRYPYAIDMTPTLQPYASPVDLSRLPFNISSGPEYVFMEETFLNDLQPGFAAVLSNLSEYGLRGYVSSTAVGPLLLYEQRYATPAQRYGPVLPTVNGTYDPRSGLVPGPEGGFVANSSAPSGFEIRSVSKLNATRDVWSGPDVFLSPGSYVVRVEVSATGTFLKSNPNASVLRLVAAGFGPTLLNESFLSSRFVPGEWTTLTANLTVVNPVPMFDLEGYALYGKATIAVASVSIQPIGGT